MKPPYWIETDVSHPLHCRSIDELASTLERLQNEYRAKGPTSVVVSEAEKSFGGDEIGLGMGLDPTFILIQIAPCNGEYSMSAGDKNVEGNVTFYGARELIVVRRRNFVPWRLVRLAIREFLEHHRRSELIRWHDASGRDA